MPQRPELPHRHQNPHIKSVDLSKLPPLKYQSLDRDGHEVLVGRMKIPTPSGHAFILRRYDTGAISLTTMFRAAFPSASEIDERKETQWAKENYNLSGNNGSGKEPHIVRLAGTWISPAVALLPEFAERYRLGGIMQHVAKATPDPSATYRRSTTKTTPKAAPPSSPVGSPTKSLLTPAPSMTMPTPKRRRESSPVPAPASPNPPQSSLPPPRRSARTKSPAPLPMPIAVKSPKAARTARAVRVAEVTTPGGSDETVVEDEVETIEIAKPSLEQDVADQMELIERLKAAREPPKMETDGAPTAPAPLKRAREDEEEQEQGLQFKFKEPETEERQIITNKRVSRFKLEPRQKSFAWGVVAFAIGMGAVSFLPNFF
ncbi:hypothetical protein PAXINDRAFT_18752 [Paxillus involutus ATCC 200175]|uniref:HTH APSES-type domain-containing protein n=1 Tax=Paxillus involutus ATCC 200175 TaxID=664439 RepID=A0A0C9TAG8_PAXIN|nr:hypothetical protein PAXINDRAFT_18752 [Paxillus involutus ATCC 200175]